MSLPVSVVIVLFLLLQLDALCPAAEELMKLTTASPGGQKAVLRSAVQVR